MVMPARKRNLWPFSSTKKKRVVRSKAELASIAETHRRAEQGYLSGGVSRSSGSRRAMPSAPPAKATTAAASYKGYLIRHMDDDSFVIPKLDPDSHFDTLKDAKQFLDSWKRN